MTSRERWVALDVVRGLTVASMLLVNNPGTWDAVYPPLEHARWHGWTPTDLIFPFFLFIVGITTEISLARRAGEGLTDRAIRAGILKRGGLIVLFGLLLAAFPFVPLTRITEVRIPGVLQRIGVCYAAAALLGWRRSSRAVVGVTATILLGYWAVLTLIPAPGLGHATIDEPSQTIAAWLDRWLLDGHLWAASKTWDPEGPLSTLPAIATALCGILAGRWMRRPEPQAERLAGLLAAGGLAMVLGLVWSWVLPINKSLWTSSYVVFTAGAAALVLGTVSWLVQVKPGWWIAPLMTYGRNPLLAFVGSGLMARAIGSLVTVETAAGRVPLQRLVFERAFATWLSPVNASLAYALAFVLFWYLVLRAVERRGWIIKV